MLISLDAARCSAWRPRSSARTGMQWIFASDTGDREGCGVGMRQDGARGDVAPFYGYTSIILVDGEDIHFSTLYLSY